MLARGADPKAFLSSRLTRAPTRSAVNSAYPEQGNKPGPPNAVQAGWWLAPGLEPEEYRETVCPSTRNDRTVDQRTTVNPQRGPDYRLVGSPGHVHRPVNRDLQRDGEPVTCELLQQHPTAVQRQYTASNSIAETLHAGSFGLAPDLGSRPLRGPQSGQFSDSLLPVD
jgi:hypothetical protein